VFCATGSRISKVRRLRVLVRNTNRTATKLRRLLETVLVSHYFKPVVFEPPASCCGSPPDFTNTPLTGAVVQSEQEFLRDVARLSDIGWTHPNAETILTVILPTNIVLNYMCGYR